LDFGLALDNDPMFAAAVMHLKGQTFVGIHANVFDFAKNYVCAAEVVQGLSEEIQNGSLLIMN